LLQTIRELSRLHRAALTLVFLHRGRLALGGGDHALQSLVLKYFSVDPESLGQALVELNESFVVQKAENQGRYWVFKHPTIHDAISAMLSETDRLSELYLRGAKLEAILGDVVCSGVPPLQNALVVAESLNELLGDRLNEASDEPLSNSQLFSFLEQRVSDDAFKMITAKYPELLRRKAYVSYRVVSDPKYVLTHALCNSGSSPQTFG
jgi:hypothetical protein